MALSKEWCPSRHIKPVIGMCSICKKSVCPDCKAEIALDMKNKIICKFCYEDLNEIQKKIRDAAENPKAKVAEGPGLIDRLYFWFVGEPEKKCTDNNHLDEKIIGMCIACRKVVCEACVQKDAKMTTGCICQDCYRGLYDVQGEIAREKKARFVGSFREFFLKMGRTTRIIIISAIVLIALSIFVVFSTMWVFYQLHPDSYAIAISDWKKGKYSLFFKEDLPEILNDTWARVKFNWDHMNDPHADYEAERREKYVKKYESIFQEPPPETKTVKDIVDAIREVKDVMEAQKKELKD